MKPAWFILIALVLLHHDFWFWDDSTLVMGWLPIGMLYHILLTLAATAFWFFAVKKLWPAFASTSVQPSVESAEATGGPAS